MLFVFFYMYKMSVLVVIYQAIDKTSSAFAGVFLMLSDLSGDSSWIGFSNELSDALTTSIPSKLFDSFLVFF